MLLQVYSSIIDQLELTLEYFLLASSIFKNLFDPARIGRPNLLFMNFVFIILFIIAVIIIWAPKS